MEQPAQTLTVLVHTAAVLACGLFAGGCGGGGGGGGGAGGGGGSGTVAVAFGAASSSVGESGGTAQLQVALDTGGATLSAAVTVDVVQTGGSATSGSDFAAFSATTVTFPAGAADGATQTVDVTILGDTANEGDETLVFDLQSPSPSNVVLFGTTRHTLTIVDDDVPSTIAFELGSSAVGESAGFTTVNVRLTSGAPIADPVTVQVVEVGGGSAASAVDYTPFGPTTVTFPAGSQNATQGVSITITNDGALEPNETFGLGLQAPTGAASLGGTTQHVVTIVDDDTPSVGFQAASSATTDESTSTFQVTLVLNAPAALATPLTVDVVDLGSGSAASGTDYTAFPTTTVTFPGGSVNGATQTVDLTPTQDTAVEVSETVVLGLQNVTNGNLGTTTQHTVTITDDDYTVAFQAATTVLASENPVATAVQLQLSTGVALPAAVSVTVSDAGSGSATSGTDYPTLPATVVTFPAGSTHGTLMAVSVGATQDALIEGAETIDLALSAPTGGATLGAQATHQVTITDDDFRVQFSAATSSTADEVASPATVTVVLATGDALAAAVSVQVADAGTGTATSGTDYAAFATTTLTFPAGSVNGATQTVSLTPVQDAVTETGGETVVLSLQNPSGAILGTDSTHTLTISDDDTSYVTFDAASSSTPDESTAARSVAVRLVTGAALVAPISVEVAALSTGTATSGTDYTAFTTTTVTFPTGSTDGSTQSVSVTPTQDSDVEAGETVLLGLQNPSGASLGTDTVHTLTITDDDVTVSFSSASSSVAEGAGTASINVVLNTGAALGAAVSVAVGPTGGTAGGSDYSLTVPTTLTFPAGSTAGATQSLAVTITDDAVVESDETLVLSLLFATGGATIVSPSSHTLTITDDDTTVSKVLYVADQDTSGVYELYLVTVTNGVASSSQKVSGSLVSGGDVSTSTTGSGVSPDGKWAAYIADQNEDGTNELFLVDISGSGPYTATRVSGDFTGASGKSVERLLFSPGSDYLVYRADQNTQGTYELYAVNLSSPGVGSRINVGLSSGEFVSNSGLRFSSSGARLTYIVNDGSTNAVIWSRRFSNNTNRRISDALVSGGAINSNGGFYNSSENLMIWWGEANTVGINELYVVRNIDTSTPDQTRVHSAFASTDNDVFYALFSPDGTKVAYSADPNVNSKIEVFAVDVSGGTPGTVRTATPSGAIDEMNAQTTFMVWSPDSTYLCYRADALVDGRFDVYAVDASNLGASLSPFLLHTVQSGRSSSSNMLWSSDSTKTLFSAIYGTESTSTELYFATVALAPQAPATMRVSQAFPSSRSVSATFSRQSESVAVTQPILSSDDALLFYRADADVDNEFEIYVVDVSGSFTTPQQVNGTLQSGTSADFTYLLLGSATRQLVYIAQEDAGTPEQLILATLPTPTNSGTFTRATLGTANSAIQRLFVANN